MSFDNTLGTPATFVDGTTTIDANWLNAVVLDYGDPQDAFDNLSDGDVAIITSPKGSGPDTKLAENTNIGIGANAINLLESAGDLLLWNGASSFVVRGYSHKTLDAYSPSARSWTASWSGAGGASDVTAIGSNGAYLFIQGYNDTNDVVDIIDLSDDSLVGTYTCVGTVGAIAIGRDHVFIVTDNGAQDTIYAVSLATAALDTGWGTSGSTGTTYAGNAAMTLNDNRIFIASSDDLEAFLVSDGTSDWNGTGYGAATTQIERMFATDDDLLVIDQLTHVGVVDGFDGGVLGAGLAFGASSSVAVAFDGRYLYKSIVGDTDISLFELNNARDDFAATNLALAAGVMGAQTDLFAFDGMNLYLETSGANTGLEKRQTFKLGQRVRKLVGSSYGQLYGRLLREF